MDPALELLVEEAHDEVHHRLRRPSNNGVGVAEEGHVTWRARAIA
jgi:hypothetical protein